MTQHLTAACVAGTSFQHDLHSELTDLNHEQTNVTRAQPISTKRKRLACIPYYQEWLMGLAMCATVCYF